MRLITTLGFDISHTLLVITRSSVKPTKVVALVGNIRGELDQRAETAYTMLKQFSNMMGIDIERIDIDVTDIATAVERILKVLDENAPAILDLGGGLRLLVLETYIAYTMLDPLKTPSITIYTALEGRNEIIHIDVGSVKRKMISSKLLEDTTTKVLKIIQEKEIITPREIMHEISKLGYKITKQKLSKILTKLVKMGYIEKVERGRYKYKP